ncbi:MAG: efflux RND transporter periplasmic adaptor subunit [Caldilineaceae bacterium]|nr:efflux RND transporter periplasmic adaptor subunit [Caldilineaceae bacterium]
MQKRPFFRRLLRWVGMVLGVLFLFGLGYFVAQSGWLDALVGVGATGDVAATRTGQAGAVVAQEGAVSTVPIRSAAAAVGVVSAAGNLELVAEQQVVVQVGGIVAKLPVKVGDQVEAGDLLAVLDSTEAERAVEQALLSMTAAQADYDNQLDGGDALDIAAAEASLRAAQEKLADVKAGASAPEIAAAQASLAAAQASYQELQTGPTQPELTQLATAMRKAEVAVAEAQTNYDAIAWRNDAGMTSQAAELQSATLDYEDALAAYEQATAPATAAELQSALSDVQNAQEQLDTLLAQPNAAEIAEAESQVASAESSLKLLQAGGDTAALETARVQLAQAQLDLNNAVADLAHTEIRAPVAGSVLSLALTRGQQVSSGTVAVTLADVSQLQLTVNVAEVDVEQVQMGQPAAITLDALPGQSFEGVVTQMAPASDPDQSVVNYPVTIQLNDANLRGVRAGMTAVATLQNPETVSGWLVPRNAVKEVDGRAQVAVVRNGATLTVPVTTGSIQGEWVVVESPELQEGDAAVGSVTSLVGEDSGLPFGPGAGGGERPAGGARFGRPDN